MKSPPQGELEELRRMVAAQNEQLAAQGKKIEAQEEILRRLAPLLE